MRIRTIKPSFFNNDQLAELPPICRLLFIGLWGLADVKGRLEDRPKRIKASVLPYDDIDVDKCLARLFTAGFIIRYESNGTQVIQVVNFEKHQRIGGKELGTTSEFEPFTGSSTGEAPGKHPGSTGEAPGSAGREGKGREGKISFGDPLSGKPDSEKLPEYPEQPPEPPKKSRYENARPVLFYLNEKAGRQFRETDANLKLIGCRMEEVQNDFPGVCRMIDRMVAKWKGDPKMEEFLRPETLFGKTKFGSYYDNRELPVMATGPVNVAREIPISTRIRAAENLIETINERIKKIHIPDPNLDPDGHKAAIDLRTPLRLELINVRKRLEELRKEAVA